MRFRYLIEHSNGIITSVSQIAYIDEKELNDNQFYLYTDKEPSYFFNCIVENNNSIIYLGERGPYDIIDVKNKCYTKSLQLLYDGMRSKRDLLLKESDWTQLPDVPLATKEKWAVYRQALRDITQQSDPFNIVWPEPPQ